MSASRRGFSKSNKGVDSRALVVEEVIAGTINGVDVNDIVNAAEAAAAAAGDITISTIDNDLTITGNVIIQEPGNGVDYPIDNGCLLSIVDPSVACIDLFSNSVATGQINFKDELGGRSTIGGTTNDIAFNVNSSPNSVLLLNETTINTFGNEVLFINDTNSGVGALNHGMLMYNGATGTFPSVEYFTSRGTTNILSGGGEVPATLVNGDAVSEIRFRGDNGTGYGGSGTVGAYITAIVDNVPVAGTSTPMRLEFLTQNLAGALLTAMTIDSNQLVTIPDANITTSTLTDATIVNSLTFTSGGAADLTGTATLVAGSATVNTTAVQAGSRIFLTANTFGGTPGFLSAPSGGIIAGTSFTITSTNVGDTSTVNWVILN